MFKVLQLKSNKEKITVCMLNPSSFFLLRMESKVSKPLISAKSSTAFGVLLMNSEDRNVIVVSS